jgi:hypothetical protein
MSTPEQDRSRTPPSKTPGWGAGLFSMFSTAKKPRHVEFSTEATTDAAPSPSTANNSFPSNDRASTTKLNLSNSSSKTLSSPSAMSPADRTSLDSPVVLPPSSPTVGFKPTSMAIKSPWKSPSRKNGVRFPHGVSGSASKSTASAASQKVVPFRAQLPNRRRPYKPKAHLLVTQKLKRPASSIDPALAVRALERSKSSFAPSTKQLQQKRNFVSFKQGKRLLGPSQRATRLPSITYQDEPQPEENDTAMLEDSNVSAYAPSSKRQKKVCFTAGWQEQDAPVVQEVATPARRIQMPRTATPFKSYAAMEEDDDDDVMEAYTPSHSNKKSNCSPLPEPVDLLPDAFAEPPDMGPAVAGDTLRPIYNILSTLPDASTKTPKMDFATYDQAPYEREIAMALQKEKENERKKKEEKLEEAAALADNGENSTKRTRTAIDATWKCACGAANPSDESNCLTCKSMRSTEVVPGGWGNLFVDRYKGMWKCDVCEVYTNDDKNACDSCETSRPGPAGSSSAPAPAGDKPATAAAISSSGFTFGGASSTSTTTANKSKESSSISTGGFMFSAAPAPVASSGGGFSFGGAAPAAPAAASASTGGGFTFGGSSPAPAPSNGGGGFTFATSSSTTPAAKEEKPSDVPGFSFGSTTSEKKSEETDKATFSFGAAKPLSTLENGDKTRAETPAAPKFSFGAAPTDGSSTPAPLGSIKPQAPATEPNQKRSRGDTGESLSKSVTKDSKPTFSFGSQPTAEKDSAKDSKPTFSFAGSSESAAAAPTFSFGSTPAAASANSQPITPAAPLGSLRSGPSDDRSKRRRDGGDDSKNDTPAPAFGATSSSSAAPPAPAFSFGSTPAPAPALSSSNLFGSTPAPASSQTAATTFGSKPGDSSAAPVPFGNAPEPGGFSFGQAPAPAPGETQTPAFAFGSNSGPTGGQPAAPPMFGNDSSALAPASQMFGGTPAPASAAPPMFGASTPGQPGSTPAPQGPAFGSTPNPFGGAAPAPAAPTQGFSFGSTPAPATTPGFGSTPAQPAPGGFGSTPAPPAPGGFGSTPAQAPGGFGSTPVAPTPGFSYGGAPPQQQTPGPAPFTPFGGAPTPAAAPSYGGGGFNSAPPPGGGFGGGGFNSAPQQPAPGGFGGGGFGGTPNPAIPGTGMDQGGGGFSIGSSGAAKATGGRRRILKARRPGSGGAPRQA